MKLFEKENVVGIFRGFKQGGLEFHAEIVLPYKNSFQSAPMHGQFILIQLESEEEGVLGRITSISAEGRLSSGSGEDYGIRAVADDRAIPEDLREQYLKYCVEIRVLGVLRVNDGHVVFAASHRRLPHVGSKVAFLSDELLREVAGNNLDGVDIGFLALGEFVYSGSDKRCKAEDWMKIKNPIVIPKFQIKNLVSRRSFVFARAGFGKSNLNKLLFSSLYKTTPTVAKRGGKQVPVGTLIFDPDGEYYWPDDKGRPGLCDVSELEDKVVVFTSKKSPSKFYQSFVASSIRFDIRRLKASDVISIALPPEKQEQQNVAKLKGLSDERWRELVDLIYKDGNAADEDKVKELLRLKEDQTAEMVAARANMTRVVKMLHDPSSQMLDMLLNALKDGKLCVIDISQLRGESSLVLSGMILQKIFDFNQQQFTEANPMTIPTIAVIEEAQSVLGNNGATSPYVSWVKEGRKYDLGAVLITQQPGSIDGQILSQGDNWFVFHLLSAYDLQSLKRANAHFSDDILAALLNEPIVGNGVFWSSAGGKSYPIPIRILSFEELYKPVDSQYDKDEGRTYAMELKKKFGAAASKIPESVKKEIEASSEEVIDLEGNEPKPLEEPSMDFLAAYSSSAILSFKNDVQFVSDIRTKGKPWYGVKLHLKNDLPDIIPEGERDKIAFDLVPKALNEAFGEDGWKTEKRPKVSGTGMTVWVIVQGEDVGNGAE